ncbi:hypothetical protein JCM6882_002993 [Rhodosporidiobolus microsporus]
MLSLRLPSRLSSALGKPSTPRARTLSTVLTPASHAQKCSCARCAPRTSVLTSTPAPPRPTSSSSPASVRALSTLGVSSAAHPRTCACARCAPRTIASPSSTAPSRPRAIVGAGGAATEAGVEGKRGMKVRSSIKAYCDGCSVVRRKGTLFVICSKDPKHKQRQG